jgi:rhamnogalacturonan endolyase
MTYNAFGQRHMESLTRGLVAVKSFDNIFLSWRMFATDTDSVRFNLYRNDTLVNPSPVEGISNYVDSSGTVNCIYYLETIYDIATTEISTPVTVWHEQYKSIPLQSPGEEYYPNDASVADLDGDGEMEIIVKMEGAARDNSQSGDTDPVFLHAYKMNGTFLWSIDLGVNIRAGAHYTQFMVYDLDGDGIAEIACKTAPGTKDGTNEFLSKGPAATDDDNASYVNSAGYILSGPEYLSVFDGITGKELSTVYYTPGRHPDTEDPTSAQLNAIWGDGYGNRVDRFLACVAYFDSIPSLVMCRGYYTRTVLAAWDFKGDTLTQRWIFDSDDGFPSYEGQGNHNLSVADVDEDGKDEIVYGAMCIDDDGTGLWTTGFGHGDAMHVSDIDPDRPGLEKWGITEPGNTPGSQLLDARTGEVIWETPAGDVARGVAGDLTADFYGMECWGGTDRLRSAKNELAGNWPSSSNFVIWWDGDLLRELLDGVTVSKYNTTGDIQLFSANGCITNNGTKSTPTISGDILGDWREEMVFKTLDNQELRIYTTTTPTEYGIYTLLQDPQYRLALTWQNVAYNQPPHPGFYLGHGMDLDSLPVPDIKVHKGDAIPSVHITSPVNGFELGLGLNLDLIVHAVGISDTNQTIIISDGNTALDTIAEAPYYTSIPGLTTGDYSLYASAYNIEGNLMKSDTITISVDEGYPHVTLTSPIEGYTYLPEDSLTIMADAYDTDGSIDSVVFYMNDNRLTAFASSPYSIKIESPGIGIHALKAIAWDNDTKFTESEEISVEVGLSNTIQEAEIGFCGFENGSGWIESNHVGYTGTGFANSDNVSGVQIIWAIDFPDAGTYKFEWRYAASGERPGRLLLNNTNVSDVPFGNTVEWTTWETISVNANAPEGITKVGLEATGGSGLPNIDYLKIYSLESSEIVTGVHCDSIIPTDVATLSGLSVDGAVLNPVFNENTFSYSIALYPGTTEINILATPTDTIATVAGNGTVAIGSTARSVDVVVTARDGFTTQTYTINYDFVTSVNELNLTGPNVYPIPAQNYINISMHDNAETINTISIYSGDGRKILTTGKINTNQTRIELPEMQNGIYILNVNTNNNSYSRKFTISNR